VPLNLKRLLGFLGISGVIACELVALFTFSVTNESLFSSVCFVRSVVINYRKPLIQSDFLNIITTERTKHTERVERALLTEKLPVKVNKAELVFPE
jgi:hypothetical protein